MVSCPVSQSAIAAGLEVWKAAGHRNNHPEGVVNATGLVLPAGRDTGGQGRAWNSSLFCVCEEFSVTVLGMWRTGGKPEKLWRIPTSVVGESSGSGGGSCPRWLSCRGAGNSSMEAEGCRKLQSCMYPRLKRMFPGDLSLFLPPSLPRNFLAIFSQSPNHVGVLRGG